jgi:hypothetical protein
MERYVTGDFPFRLVSVSSPQTIADSSSAQSEVEALLLEHPDVIDASLINEEGPDGHTYPVAYVVPHAERVEGLQTLDGTARRASRVHCAVLVASHIIETCMSRLRPEHLIIAVGLVLCVLLAWHGLSQGDLR